MSRLTMGQVWMWPKLEMSHGYQNRGAATIAATIALGRASSRMAASGASARLWENLSMGIFPEFNPCASI